MTSRLRSALVLSLCLFLVIPLSGGTRSVESTRAGPMLRTATSASPVRVLVSQIEPRAPSPTDVLHVSGTVVANGSQTFSQVRISLHLGSAVGSRSELGHLRADPTAQPLATRQQPLGSGTLAPGAPQPFDIAAPIDELPLKRDGVYPLQVTVVGRTADGFRDLGTASTFLPYLPSLTGASDENGSAPPPPAVPLPVAWILPLADRPNLAASGGVLDETQLAQLAEGGRLDRILKGAQAARAGVVSADPALLAAAQIQASDRHLVGPEGTGPQGEGVRQPARPAARSWVARLRTLHALTLVARPFGDLDIQAVTHAGNVDLLRSAADRSAAVLREVAGQPGSPLLATPADRTIDDQTLDVLAGLGARAVLLNAAGIASAEDSSSGSTAPVARLDNGTRVQLIRPDAALNDLVADGPSSDSTPRVAEQDLLAETAELYLSGGGSSAPAPLVLAPPTDWDPAGDWAARAVSATGDVPWLRQVDLPGLLAARGTETTPVPAASALPYPASDRDRELPVDAVNEAQSVLSDAANFAQALPPRQQVTRPVDDVATESLSTRWRPEPIAGENLRHQARAGLDRLRGSVRVVASRQVTLTSRNGRVPVTLENNLPEPVSVVLLLTSLDRSRVRSDTRVPRTIRPGQKVQVEVEVHAASAGTFPVRLSLLGPEGTPLEPPTQVLVRSTAVGLVAVAVTGAALAVLLLAVLFRSVRAVRRRRSAGDRAPGAALTAPVPHDR